MKNIILNDSDNNSKLNNIRNKLSIIKEIYKFEENDLKCPSFLGSIDYQYNIIFNESIQVFIKLIFFIINFILLDNNSISFLIWLNYLIFFQFHSINYQ